MQTRNTPLYESSDGDVTVEVIVDNENETLWVTQKTMAELFNKTPNNISYHLNNIFESGELVKDEVTFNPNDSSNTGIVLKISLEAKTQPILYNLDAIISVGYRVNNKEATQFRKWSTQILKEYIVKGYVLDKNLLKNDSRFDKYYFNDLLEDIREIRASERRFYEKITDIYATSYDYNNNATITKEFFSNVQNKLHYAVSGMTAPELLISRADADKPNMGLTS